MTKSVAIGIGALVVAGIIGILAFTNFGSCLFKCSIDKNASESTISENDNQFNIHPKIAKYIENGYSKEEKEKGFRGAAKFLHQMRANQKTGRVDVQDVLKARKQIHDQKNQAASKRNLGLEWEEMGPDDIGGRCRAILIDQNNPKNMWAGGVSGGLFFSTDGGVSWNEHDVNYKMNSVSVSTIEQAANGDIYFGTGEFFPSAIGFGNNSTAFLGEGIYKSSDGGQTFQFLTETAPQDSNSLNERWAFVNEISADPTNGQRVYAATNGGLMVTENAGTTWNVVNSPDIPAPNVVSREVEVGPTGIIYASIGNTYYRASSASDNFKRRNGTGGFPASQIGRIEFAASPSDEDYVYSLISTQSNNLRGVFKSIDGGRNWQTIANSANQGSFNPLGTQGIYDMAINVDPSNKNRIYVAGQLELWNYSNSSNWNLAGFWAPNNPTNRQYVHADMHEIQFHPTNPKKMFVGTDGGVFYTPNANKQFPDFFPRNKGFNVTQFYAATAASSGIILGGTQDNGTRQINFSGNTPQSSEEVNGGDGGDVAASNVQEQISFTELPNGVVLRSTDGGNNYTGFFDSRIDGPDPDDEPDDGTLFIAPYSLWEKKAPQEIAKKSRNQSNGSFAANLMEDSVFIEVSTNLLLDSLTVYPNSAGSFIMMLKDAQSNRTIERDTFQANNTPASRINVGWALDDGRYHIVAKDISTNGLFRENVQPSAFPYDANKFIKILGNGSGNNSQYYFYYDWKLNTPNPSILMLGAQGSVWFTDDAINVGAQPTWYKINMPGSAISAVANSDDGTFYVGSTGGDVFRIDGLAEANYFEIEEDSLFRNSNPTNGRVQLGSATGIQRTRITNNSSFEGFGRFVTGIDVNPFNKDQIIATLGSYGNSEYIYKAENASTANIANFTSIQGTLPPMPVYDALIEYYENNSSEISSVIIGTEMGIWSTSDASVPSGQVQWVDETSDQNLSGEMGIPRVPTFTIREKEFIDSDCKVVYAGTYGRGIFRTVTLLEKNRPNCRTAHPTPDEVTGIADEEQSGEGTIKHFNFYPNPVDNQGTLEYEFKTSIDQANLHVVNLLGQTVKSIELNNIDQSKTINIDFSDISRGTYLLTVQASNGVTHSTKIVVGR